MAFATSALRRVAQRAVPWATLRPAMASAPSLTLTTTASAPMSTAAVGGEGAREEQRSGFSSQLAPFALAGVAVAAVAAPLAAAEASAASTAPVVWGELGEVVMYSYAVCPFCNKVRAFLDLHKVPYRVVEVNPLYKGELAWSEYKKVPVVTVAGEQLNDSTNIMVTLSARMAGKKGWFGSAGKSAAALEEEEKWLAWVDGRLVHVLTPNIYRTAGEAVQAFDYITTAGNFSFLERYYPLPMPLNSTHRESARWVGAVMMYVISKMVLKKKHGITDERASLYEALDDFAAAVGPKRDFLGGKHPCLADTATFGVLRAVKGMDTFTDVMKNTNIAPWYERMQALVGEGCQVK